MNVLELSQEIERFFAERRKVLHREAETKGDYGLLLEKLLDNFDEAALRTLAIAHGIMPEWIEDLSLAGVARELSLFIQQSGQWDILRARLESERPFVAWADAVSPYSVFLPLKPDELINSSRLFQAALLLNHHFSALEMGRMIDQLDQTVDWQNPPYALNRPQLAAAIICYVAGRQKMPQLLALMKGVRPHIPALQQFSWQEPEPSLPHKSPEELFQELKAAPVIRPPLTRFPLVEEWLARHFSLLDLDEMCLEAGIDYDWFGSRTVQGRAYDIASFLERTSPGPMGVAFIAACVSKAPEIAWAKAVAIEREMLPAIDSVATKGFYFSRVRALLEQCLPENVSIFDFVAVSFPRLRQGLSLNWSPQKNRLEMIYALKLSGRLPDLLAVVEREYPEQFLLFAPYFK